MKKLFIDSDILIDLLAQRKGFYSHALKLLELITSGKMKGYTSPIVIANVHYILLKYSLNKVESRNAIRKIRKILSILAIDEQIIDVSIESNFEDFEDAIQYEAAKKNNIDFIITRNLKDYVKSSIPVFTAEDFLLLLDQEYTK